MNDFFSTNYSWGDFIGITVLLLIIYFALRVFHILLERFNLLGNAQKNVKTFLHYLFLIYEPVAVLLITGVFVLVNPQMNGLIVLLLFLLGGNYFRSYVSGRFMGRDASLAKGKRLAVDGTEGIIYELERFGVQLQTRKGKHFVSYSKMLKNGYTILGGDEVGGILHLKITANDEQKDINHKEHLIDLLVSTPYLDRIQKPILNVSEDNPNSLEARISVKETGYFPELQELFNDWGYSCKILKTN